MFIRFNREEDLISKNILKSSLQRNIRSKVMDCYPIAKRIPMFSGSSPSGKYKTPKIIQYKCSEKRCILASGTISILFSIDIPEQIYYPTLRLVHQCKYMILIYHRFIYCYYFTDPELLPALYVDTGAIVPIMQGADVMIPGLFKVDSEHPIPQDLVTGQVVVSHYCIILLVSTLDRLFIAMKKNMHLL